MSCSEENSVIVFSMFHGGLGVCDNARVEDLGFQGAIVSKWATVFKGAIIVSKWAIVLLTER